MSSSVVQQSSMDVRVPISEKKSSDHPAISVVMITDKLGGLDLTFEGLMDQTFKDFELVIVDEERLYWERRAAVTGFFSTSPFPVRHIPIKRHFFYQRTYGAACNTGFANSRSEDLICQICDYMYLPPDYLENHWKYYLEYNGKACISGYKYGLKITPEIQNGSDNVTDPIHAWGSNFNFKTFTANWTEGDKRYYTEPTHQWTFREILPINFVTKQQPWIVQDVMSYPVEGIMKVNGFDEALDKEFSMSPWEMVIRLSKAGYRIFTTNEIFAYHLYHPSRPGGVPPNRAERVVDKMKGVIDGKYGYYAERNPYDLAEMRASLMGKR